MTLDVPLRELDAQRLHQGLSETILMNTLTNFREFKKGDCNYGFYSDHIILSTDKIETLISMLMNCMLIHGHSAEDLLASVIASIPKCI